MIQLSDDENLPVTADMVWTEAVQIRLALEGVGQGVVRTMGANNIFWGSWQVYNEGMFNFLNAFDCLVWVCFFFSAADMNVRIIIPRFRLLDW